MSDNVIFLAYRNDTPTETQEVLSCKSCKNKMWKAVYLEGSRFPSLQCGCCGTDGGRFGWVGDDEE